MSQSTVTPSFSIKDIDVSKLGNIHIIDVSEDLYFGRRFQVMYVDSLTNAHTISKDVKFSKIVKTIKNISKTEDNLENLTEIKSFLGTLKKMEKESISAFPDKGCLYRFFTRFSRIFSSGSHLDRIKALEANIQGKIEKKDPTSLSVDARMMPIKHMDFAHAESALLQLIEDCITARQLDDAFSVCGGYIIDYKKSDELYVRIARAFIERGDLAKAVSVVNRISSKKEEKIEVVQELVTACLIQDIPNKAVADRAISLLPYNDANLALIEELRRLVDNA